MALPLPSEDVPTAASTPSTVSPSATALLSLLRTTTPAPSENSTPSAALSRERTAPPVDRPWSLENRTAPRGPSANVPPHTAMSWVPSRRLFMPTSMAYNDEEQAVSSISTSVPSSSQIFSRGVPARAA